MSRKLIHCQNISSYVQAKPCVMYKLSQAKPYVQAKPCIKVCPRVDFNMFVFIPVNMGITLSSLRIGFFLYRLIAKSINISPEKIDSLANKVSCLLCSSLYKLKEIH